MTRVDFAQDPAHEFLEVEFNHLFAVLSKLVARTHGHASPDDNLKLLHTDPANLAVSL